MNYRNDWGDEGTYAEVFTATVARMDTDALVDELSCLIFEEDLLRWILETVPEEFKRDYAPAINNAIEYWVGCHVAGNDEDD